MSWEVSLLAGVPSDRIRYAHRPEGTGDENYRRLESWGQDIVHRLSYAKFLEFSGRSCDRVSRSSHTMGRSQLGADQAVTLKENTGPHAQQAGHSVALGLIATALEEKKELGSQEPPRSPRP